jgi:uncharacterized protein (TIGR02266 family)
MTQDTRKDRRVKIVSLNVRYKSATVDEFIENHAHDVSRGGIYIKTATPFPQGTLLKFEIRLASDQTVITGVGRVVWKREAAEGEQPAGMGVKFIKVDDSSKVVIDRLVTTKSDAGKAFESEPDPTAHARPSAPAEALGPPSSPPGSKRKVTPYKVASLGPPGLSGGPPPIPRPGASSGSPSSAPRPVAPSPLFPKATSVAPDGPKPEQTVMKQAAELLEEALREAGGSMEEVGTNPLFSGDLPASDAKAAGAPMGSTSAAPPANRSKAPSKAVDEGAAARGMVAALSPGQVTGKSGTGEPPRKPAVSTSIPAPRKSGTRLGLILGAIGVVAILALVLNKDRLFGSGPEPSAPSAAPSQPSPSVAASAAVEAPAPSAVEAPAPSASAAPAPSTEPSSQPSPPAASASAGSKPVTAAPPASAAPQATKPAVVAQAPTAAPTATAQAPSAPATAAPDSSSGAPSAASAAPRAPKPAAPPAVKAPPKAAKPSDNDNPY